VKNNIKALIILPIMLFASLFVIETPSVHAATGLVCLGPDGSTTCSAPPVSITGKIGTSVRVAVVISGSDAFDTIDITVLADHTILKPTSVDSTGSILTASTANSCLQGVSFGITCLATDTIDTAHVIASGSRTTSPTTGLLFTVVYQVVANTEGTPIGFQTGCSGASSIPGLCINVVSAGTSLSETSQGATFSTPDFIISASPSTVNLSPGTTGTSTLKLTAVGGYSDCVDVAIKSATPAIPASVTGSGCGFTTSAVDLHTVASNTATLSVGPAAAGSYVVVVTATGEALFSTVVPTHDVTVTVNVGSQDFSVKASPSSLSIPHGSSGVSTITVGSLVGFSGMVSLTASSSTTGITASPASNSVTAPSSFQLTISVASTVLPGVYTVTETGTATIGSTLVPHSAIITVNVGSPSFSVSVFPGDIGIFRGSSAAALITVQSINNFAGTVILSAKITNTTIPDSAGSTTVPSSFTQSSAALTAGGSATSNLIILAPDSTATGFYIANVTGTTGSITSFAILNFDVQDFSMSPAFPTFTITNQTGITSTDLVTVTALGGLNAQGGTGVSAVPSGTPPVLSTFVPELGRRLCLLDTFYANGTKVPNSVLSQTGPVSWVGFTRRCGRNDGFAVPTPGVPDVFADANGNPGIQIRALSNTAPGVYTIKLIAVFGLLTRTLTITLNVVAAPVIHQLAQFPTTVSFSGSGGVLTFKVGITSPSANNVFVNVQMIAVGSTGQFTSGTSATFKVNGGGNANNIPISLPLKQSAIGGTFTLQAIINVGLSPDALTGISIQGNVFSLTFTVTP
jgi:hypothetical protein